MTKVSTQAFDSWLAFWMRPELWLQSLLPIRVNTSVDMESMFSADEAECSGLIVASLFTVQASCVNWSHGLCRYIPQ